MKQLINYEGVYRTAQATPGLLIILVLYYHSCTADQTWNNTFCLCIILLFLKICVAFLVLIKFSNHVFRSLDTVWVHEFGVWTSSMCSEETSGGMELAQF